MENFNFHWSKLVHVKFKFLIFLLDQLSYQTFHRLIKSYSRSVCDVKTLSPQIQNMVIDLSIMFHVDSALPCSCYLQTISVSVNMSHIMLLYKVLFLRILSQIRTQVKQGIKVSQISPHPAYNKVQHPAYNKVQENKNNTSQITHSGYKNYLCIALTSVFACRTSGNVKTWKEFTIPMINIR